MDAAGCAKDNCAFCPVILCILLLCCTVAFTARSCYAAATSSNSTQASQLQKLADSQQWQKIIALAEQQPAKSGTLSADLQFYYGTALAQTGRMAKARQVFQQAKHRWPADPRFPVELAGVEFKQKDYSQAAKNLRHALRLKSADSAYIEDFLATIYYLQGNVPAALKHWNRIGKPHVVNIEDDPVPKTDPVLLDRAFAVSPASTLRLPDLLTTESRLGLLNVFSQYSFALQARPENNFDLDFRNSEKNGWSGNKWMALALMLRGLPAQMVYPEFPNIGHEGLNFSSSYRWDKEKRRIQADFSGPVFRNPKEQFALQMDLRNENWSLRQSFQGPAPPLGSFNLRKEAAAARFRVVESGRWQWSSTTEFSHRDFRSVVPGPALPAGLLFAGDQLKETLQLDTLFWNDPDHKFTAHSHLVSQTGSIWSSPRHTFEKLQASAHFRWLPMPDSDDYEVDERVNVGKAYGTLPFDELWALGIGGDNDLWMRGHIATRDGRKGSAPLGTRYFLSNWELDKNIHDFGLFRVQAGPLLDTGTMHDAIPALGSQKWLWDVGAQVKALAFGMGVSLSYGKDLRSGNNALYVTFVHNEE